MTIHNYVILWPYLILVPSNTEMFSRWSQETILCAASDSGTKRILRSRRRECNYGHLPSQVAPFSTTKVLALKGISI